MIQYVFSELRNNIGGLSAPALGGQCHRLIHAASKEEVRGSFGNDYMSFFLASRDLYYASTPYSTKEEIKASAPEWVRTTYVTYKAKENARYKPEPVPNNTHQDTKKSAPVYGSCFYCHGTGKQEVLTNNTYQRYDRYGNKQGTTSYKTITCTYCHGTGHN